MTIWAFGICGFYFILCRKGQLKMCDIKFLNLILFCPITVGDIVASTNQMLASSRPPLK